MKIFVSIGGCEGTLLNSHVIVIFFFEEIKTFIQSMGLFTNELKLDYRHSLKMSKNKLNLIVVPFNPLSTAMCF